MVMKSWRVCRAGAAPVISNLMDCLGISGVLDSVVPWDERQCKLSVSNRVKAMVINILAGRTPLYNMGEYFEHQDMANLFGEGISFEDVTDDSLARGLDKIHQANPRKVISSALMTGISREGVKVDAIHGDTTSISVYGQYERDDIAELAMNDRAIAIMLGHSKDHRPDLKQLKAGLFVTSEGIPVMGEALDGNMDDKTWSGRCIETLKKMESEFDKIDLDKITYVADSALATKGNLRAIHELERKDGKKGLYFVTRLPATFKMEHKLIEEAWDKDTWVELGKTSQAKDAAVYRSQMFIRSIEEIKYKLVVVHSSKLDGRKQKSITKKIEQLKVDLEKAATELENREYACRPDAEKGLKRFVKEHNNEFYELAGEVVEVERNKRWGKRGRPPKDYIPEVETIYQVKCSVGEAKEASVNRAFEQASCFVLITNRLSDNWDSRRILREYKDQHSVEASFSFMKNPTYLDAIFLKKPERVEALTYVMILALFIYQILQRRVRAALAEEDSYVTVNGLKLRRPTGNRVLQLLRYIHVAMINDGEKESRQLEEMERSEPLDRVLRLVGFTREIYLTTRAGPRYLLE
jgi:transposase